MLELEKMHVSRGSFDVRADISMSAPVTALLGPSGAGKSTLFDVVAGFAAPQTGRVLWQGRDITSLTPADRPVACLFQDNNLFPHLSVLHNVALALTAKTPTRDQRLRIDRVLEAVGLDELGDRMPGTLSGGQQSRVALARVMLQDRPLLLLDEPFAALGPALKKDMLDRVAALARGGAHQVIMISHDPADARQIAQDIAVTEGGVVTSPQPTEDVLADPPAGLAEYLGLKSR